MLRLTLRLLFVAVLAGLLGPGSLADTPRKPPGKLEGLMTRKLNHAQKVLEGVALQDFEQIAKHARELTELSRQADWQVLRTPLYQLYTEEFRTTTGNLEAAARKKNVEGAALAYVEMTLVCVKCHKHVRERRMALAD